MDLFFRKKHNTEEEDELDIRTSDLYPRPKKEKSPAKIYGLLFILLFIVSVTLLLASDREPAGEDPELPEETPVTAAAEDVPEFSVLIPDYNQQPGQAHIDYPRYEKNSVVYELRDTAAYVVGSVGGAKDMKYLTIEKSVKNCPVVEICEGAFIDCTKLQKVHIPDSVIIIRDSAFENCAKLENVRMSEKLITMGRRVFAGCSSLKSLKFPATVKELSADVFEGAVSLTNLRIPESCTIPEGDDPFGVGTDLIIDIYS